MTVVDQIRGVFIVGLNVFVRPPVLMAQASKEAEGGRGQRWALPLLRGLLLAIPLLCVFGALFASADLFFAGYLRRVFQQLSLADLMGRAFAAAMLTWGICALLALTFGDETPAIPGEVHAPSPDAPDAVPVAAAPVAAAAVAGPISSGAVASAVVDEEATPRETQPTAGGALPATAPARPRLQNWRLLGFVETTVMLVLVNLLFLSFVVVQIRHFFLEVEDFDLVGTTHADYAREGFFQLLVAAFLTLGLIWTLALIAHRDTASQDVVFNSLAGLMTICVLVMLISSFRRLELYEIEYGFTEQRMLSHSFTVWIGVIFLFTLAALLTKRWGILAFGLLSAAIVYVAGFDLVNPDAYIARRNLERAIEGKQLDTRHLTVLSSDAVPTIAAFYQSLQDPERRRIEQNLAVRLRDMKGFRDAYDWRSWNLSREQAYAALSQLTLPEPRAER
jgi:hypothetical protein